MSLRRVGILLQKELVYGSKSFIVVLAVVAPIVLSFALSLVFGTLFSEKPELGIADEGASAIVALAAELDSVVTKEYSSDPALRGAVEAGVVDMGIVLPPGFDELIAKGEPAEITAYIWGESLAKNRTILRATIASLIREAAGQEVPIEIAATTLGDAENVPWNDRLLPLIVLYAVLIGGSMVPAASLTDEKQKRTLTALTVTPSTLGEVFLAKGFMGASLSLIMGIIILVLNQAFGAQPLQLLLVLVLGAIMAAEFGLWLGALVKDISTLFTIIKAIGILLYAPGIVYLFPQIPEWVGKIFPTFYIIRPIVEISQRSGDWPDIALDVLVLCGLIVLLAAVLAVTIKKTKQREA